MLLYPYFQVKTLRETLVFVLFDITRFSSRYCRCLFRSRWSQHWWHRSRELDACWRLCLSRPSKATLSWTSWPCGTSCWTRRHSDSRVGTMRTRKRSCTLTQWSGTRACLWARRRRTSWARWWVFERKRTRLAAWSRCKCKTWSFFCSSWAEASECWETAWSPRLSASEELYMERHLES